MSLGKLAVLAIALSLVSGGVGAALADWNSPEPGPAIDIVNVDARIEDDVDGALVAEPEDDDAPGGDKTLPPLAAPEARKDDEPAPAERPQAALAPVQPVPAGPSASDDGDTGGGAGGGGGDDDDDAGGGEDDDGGDD